MRKIILIFFLSLVLFGCQKGEDDVLPKENVNNIPLYESNEFPKSLQLRQEKFNILFSEVGYHCWAKDSIEDECMTELNDQQLKKLDDLREQVSAIGYPIELYFETHPIDSKSHLPVPDSGKLFIYKDGTYTPVEINENKFLLPEEEGVYTYIYKTIYDSENKGIGFYIFKLRARYMELDEES